MSMFRSSASPRLAAAPVTTGDILRRLLADAADLGGLRFEGATDSDDASAPALASSSDSSWSDWSLSDSDVTCAIACSPRAKAPRPMSRQPVLRAPTPTHAHSLTHSLSHSTSSSVPWM